MKKKVLMILLGMFSVLFVSCSSDEVKEQVAGTSEDQIKLSKKEATFSAEPNTITITTGESGWRVNGFALDKVKVDTGTVNLLAESFVFKNDDFEVEKKNKNTLVITMHKNTTAKDRLLTIGLQAGNYVEDIRITQSK
ncbi:hypothetical protein [Flavobacterium humidisoli]|uniref:Lipocalin-like domain-containing protein n=1 Tax=Flavobacterium humidisoli TaxID=2937442 RepID=A0ABY4LTB1_9FLAO|nr:hypothetical protein [Flavobacterium humidisoli]UPZ16314.1 hypothetical protein M0M44_02995 [Flavobacterium humidisoli]